MKFSILSTFAISLTFSYASPLGRSKRQCSTTWRYQDTGYAAPSNYKAFDVGNCAAQLSFNKDRYISVQWAFEATYPDGSRAVHVPLRDFSTFGVSDTFYPSLGNNFLTRFPGSSAFTAVHEFSNVCKGGQAPVSWRFYTTSSQCFTTDQIRAVGGVTRPAKVSGVLLRRTNDAGDFAISWTAVARAVAYSVIVEYPTGRDEIGNPYTDVRGARVQGTSTSVGTTNRSPHVPRKVVVHAVDSQGVWSLTKDVQPVVASW